jgi:hypothetical protein
LFIFSKAYFPIQKLLNISSKTSSASITLVIDPISLAATLSSSDASSGKEFKSIFKIFLRHFREFFTPWTCLSLVKKTLFLGEIDSK